MAETLPLDDAARAVHIARDHESWAEDRRTEWDGGSATHDAVRAAYRQAEAAIRAAATVDVLADVLAQHEVSQNEFGMDGAPQFSCECGDWSWDTSLKPSWESWEPEHREHVAEAQVAELLRREG